MKKLSIEEIIIVEGKYDAVALASLVDALILPTGGFAIFSDKEKQALIKNLGKQRGIIILTDSDDAGFRIRHYLQKIGAKCVVKNAYIPAVKGKEKRKETASKEGTLGVEGMPPEVLLNALKQAGATRRNVDNKKRITHTDLYRLGLSGNKNSAIKRRRLMHKLGLPTRLSKKALTQVLSSLYTFEELEQVMKNNTILCWDFHGTLTTHDVTWHDAAFEAAQESYPDIELNWDDLDRYLTRSILPWWTVDDYNTSHLTKPGAWWRHTEDEFKAMFIDTGYTKEQASVIAAKIKDKVLQPERYTLFPDTIDTLKALQKRGYTHYIVSNNFPELAPIITHLGLDPYITETLISGKVGYEKPSRHIFDKARALAGKEADMWMIGDNPASDIDGGNAAGFTTVAVAQTSLEKADYTVASPSGVLDILN